MTQVLVPCWNQRHVCVLVVCMKGTYYSTFQWPPRMTLFLTDALTASLASMVPACSRPCFPSVCMMGTPLQPHQRGGCDIGHPWGGLEERQGTSPLPGRQGPQAAQESPLPKKLTAINHSRQDAVSVSATERRVVAQGERSRGRKGSEEGWRRQTDLT